MSILLVLALYPGIHISSQNIDSLLSEYDRTSSYSEKASISIEIGTHYLTRDLQATKKYIRKAMENSEEIDTLRILALDLQGKYYFYLNNLDSALLSFSQAEEIAKALQDKKRVASIGISTGSVLLRMDRFEESIKSFIASAEYFETLNDQVNAAKCYSNISSAQARLGNFSEAIKYSEDALAIFQPNQLHQFTLLTLPNLASNYAQLGDTTQALKLFHEAEELAMRQDDERSLSRIYNNLGDLHLAQRLFTTARNYFEKSIFLKNKLRQQKGLTQNYHNLAYTYAQDGDHQKALELYHNALSTATESEKATVYKNMKDSYLALDSLKKAIYYSEQARFIEDSLLAKTNMQTIAEINAKYETAKKENEILRLESEKQRLQIRQTRNKYLYFGIIVLLVVGMLIAYLMVKNSRRKNIIAHQNHHLEKQKMLEELRSKELEAIDLVVQGQDQERSRIASDLHDSLGSKMAALKLYLESIPEDTHNGQLYKARELANLTYKEIRTISHSLASGVLLEKGLVPALNSMASFINSANEINMDVIEVELKNSLNNTMEIQLLRIIQELVTNVIKHAKARNIVVQLTQHAATLNVMIEDDGIGFDVLKTELGMGFYNIEHRIEQIKGTFDIDSSPGHGTTVLINIPL
ncbi:MAG: tetratricopeptide repeat protein [Saprospiraceae bacterium]|nr:tetratricopeptide repeat protein [Saprospiraceae bacterium]